MHDGDIDCNQQLLSEDEMSDEADQEKVDPMILRF